MKQGVLSQGRVRLLLKEGSSCYRTRRAGERKRKSVRGCIVGPDMSVVNLIVKRKGDGEIEGLTDTSIPMRLGPKRANKIRKLFNLTKEDDVRKSVVNRKFKTKAGKEVTKRPNIQRLVTPITLKRKATRAQHKLEGLQHTKQDKATYAALVAKRMSEAKDARRSEISKRRSSRKASSRKE
jgi:small subunit ribosomal protein S6e